MSLTPTQQIEKLIADQARRISDLEAALRTIAKDPFLSADANADFAERALKTAHEVGEADRAKK